MRISLMSSFALSEFNLQLNSDNKSNSETNKKPSTMIEEDSLALRMVPLVQQQGLIDYSSKSTVVLKSYFTSLLVTLLNNL